MNIFMLDYDIDKCCELMVDRHVVKMPTETCQLLSGAFYFTGQDSLAPYKLTHKNHPCSVWARDNKANWEFLRRLGLAICAEYTYRYAREHACESLMREMVVPNLPDGEFCWPPSCMDVECKVGDDVVQNYRNYYRTAKSHIHSWKRREKPCWI